MPIESPNGATPTPAPAPAGVVEQTLDAAIRQQVRVLEEALEDLTSYTERAAQASRARQEARAALAELRAARAKLTQEA